MNIKKNSLVVKTLKYLFFFSAIILLVLWVFQILFLKLFYEKYQIDSVKNIGKIILKNNSDTDLEKIAYENNVCIEALTNGYLYSYNTKNKDCILNSTNTKIQNAKLELIQNGDNKLITLIDPRYNSKSVIYGISIDNGSYIFINTTIEDVNSTTFILRNQLIYITLIVIVLAFVISIFVSKMINSPILRITDKARKMAKGDYTKDSTEYDIAEINELNDVLNYARSEIENTDNLRKDLMANVSHDLKTPLTMIKAYAEMARDINSKDIKKRNDNLNIIIDEVDRLNILVNDILDMSKLQSDTNQKLDYENYDLKKELDLIINKYDIIKQTEKYIFVVNSPEKVKVRADKKRINQVLYNLINNAINYTGDDLKVSINIKEYNNKYLIEIIDTGKGIKKEDINLVWSKYYKKEKNHRRNVVGTGLGLSIVKKILEMHNVEFGVKSTIGKGSNFYFYLNKSS